MQILKGTTNSKTFSSQGSAPAVSNNTSVVAPPSLSVAAAAPPVVAASSGDVTMGNTPTVSLNDFFRNKMKDGGDKGYTQSEFVGFATAAGFTQADVIAKWDNFLEECEMCPTIDDDHFQFA